MLVTAEVVKVLSVESVVATAGTVEGELAATRVEVEELTTVDEVVEDTVVVVDTARIVVEDETLLGVEIAP
jgi:hypothetical protein